MWTARVLLNGEKEGAHASVFRQQLRTDLLERLFSSQLGMDNIRDPSSTTVHRSPPAGGCRKKTEMSSVSDCFYRVCFGRAGLNTQSNPREMTIGISYW